MMTSQTTSSQTPLSATTPAVLTPSAKATRQIQILDERLGKDVGATRERTRLHAIIAQAAK